MCSVFITCDLLSYLVNGVPSRSPRLVSSGDDSVDSLLQRMVQHEDQEPLEKNIDAVIASASVPPSSSPVHSLSKERTLGKPDSLLDVSESASLLEAAVWGLWGDSSFASVFLFFAGRGHWL